MRFLGNAPFASVMFFSGVDWFLQGALLVLAALVRWDKMISRGKGCLSQSIWCRRLAWVASVMTLFNVSSISLRSMLGLADRSAKER